MSQQPSEARKQVAEPGGGALESLIRDLSQEIAALRKLVESQQQRTLFENRLRDNYLASVTQASQLLLQGHYQRLYAEGKPLPALADVEFRCHSQNGEDGIIHYVFSLVGAGPKKAVEISAGDGLECNSANLIINHGWDALLFDADEGSIAGGKEFYRTSRDTFCRPPTMVQAWINAENVDALIAAHGYSGEVGLLSVDVDGMDYWIWKAIRGISPRLVVVEFNCTWGPELSVSVPYDPQFKLDFSKAPYYCSASLAAFCKLAEEKGYRLIGLQRLGFNAFFLRKDLGQDIFPVVSPTDCFRMSRPLQSWGPHWIPSAADRPDYASATEI
jgi:hypothetical protein